MMFVPKISCVSAKYFYVLILHSFFHQIGTKVGIESLEKMSPSKETFRREIKKVATYDLISLRSRMHCKKLHYGCDAANKGGYLHMMKRIAWYDSAFGKFESAVLDSDVFEGTRIDAANVLDHVF